MRKQIDALFDLAKDYVVFGQEARLEQTHNTIRDEKIKEDSAYLAGEKMSIYFSNNYETSAVYFPKNVEVMLYCNQINIPIGISDELLDEIYKDAYDYLHNHLFPNVAKCKIETLKNKHAEIKALEAKLKALKYGKN